MARPEDPFDMMYGPFENSDDRNHAFLVMQKLNGIFDCTGERIEKNVADVLRQIHEIKSDRTFYRILRELGNLASQYPYFQSDDISIDISNAAMRRVDNVSENIWSSLDLIRYFPTNAASWLLIRIEEYVFRNRASLDAEFLIRMVSLMFSICRDINFDRLKLLRHEFDKTSARSMNSTPFDQFKSLADVLFEPSREKALFMRSVEIAFQTAKRGLAVEVGSLPHFYRKGMPPGDFLNAVIQNLGIQIPLVARHRNITKGQLYRIINGKTGISPDMAWKLDGLGDIAADRWAFVQIAYDLEQAKPSTQVPLSSVESLPHFRR